MFNEFTLPSITKIKNKPRSERKRRIKNSAFVALGI
jgi:hypothetical protein